MATPGFTLVADQLTPWFNPNLKDYTFDTAAANALLDQAGYVDTDNDGVRDMAGQARPLEFRLDYPAGYPSYMYQRLAEILNENWTAIGVRLNIQETDEDALHAKINPGFGFRHRLMGLGRHPAGPQQPLERDDDALPSRPAAPRRVMPTPNTMPLFEAQRKEMDSTKRQAMIWKMQEMILKDEPYIIPYYEQAAYAFRKEPFNNWPLGQGKIMPLYPANLAGLTPNQ